MKLQFEQLKGFNLQAEDGLIGNIKDVLFDDHRWGGRWLVADTGEWLPGRKVLLSPISLEDPDPDKKRIPVRMSKQEISDSPPLEEDAPVSLQYEKTFYDQFYWPYYWIGGGLWANQTVPAYLDPKWNQEEIDTTVEPDPEHREHVLRSADELKHYQANSSRTLEPEGLGTVTDLVIDTGTWSIPYLILQNRRLMPSKKILVPQDRVVSTGWREHAIHLDLDENVFSLAPGMEETDCISREDEDRARAFFDRP
ncbi:MAG: PRC-barrel domain-containing protein [Kiritimatiellia bacterium]